MLNKTNLKLIFSIRGAKDPAGLVDKLETVFIDRQVFLTYHQICAECEISVNEGMTLFSGRPVIIDGNYIQNIFIQHIYSIELVDAVWSTSGSLYRYNTVGD